MSTSTVTSPPLRFLYSQTDLLGEDGTNASIRTALPAYEQQERRERTVHEFEQKDSKTVIVLRVTSLAPSSKTLPLFLGTAAITGSVKIQLEKPQHILSVDVSVQGHALLWDENVANGHNHPSVGFSVVSQTLWKAEGPSKKPSIVNRLKNREGTELKGTHTFDYSLTLPETITATCPSGSISYPLPPSMKDQAHASITYNLAVTIKRGGFGGPSCLSTQISYAPWTRPSPFSSARQSVYDDGMRQLVGPRQDISGWTSLPPAVVNGRLITKKDVAVTCTLSVANPLQYTRGSFIPCFLVIESEDEQTLDLLAAPNAAVVGLIATLRLADKATRCREHVTKVESAQWWTDPSSKSAPARTRHLFGEIHLPVTTTPPFKTPDIELSYEVGLLGFSAPGYQPRDGPTGSLGMISVDIVTGTARGSQVRPIPCTRPSGKKSRKQLLISESGGIVESYGVLW